MNTQYQQALAGTLASAPTGGMRSLRFWNNLPVDAQLFYLAEDASRCAMGVVPAGYAINFWVANGDSISWSCRHTGSFIGVCSITSSTPSVFFGPHSMVAPNDIGLPPQPTAEVVIPPDSPRVLVAAGLLENRNRTLREQYWRRLPESYTIAPGETQTVSTTSTSNMQQTSSSTDTVSASLGTSASAGWGPMSVGISASLSASSTSSQEVSLSTEYTAYVSDTLTATQTYTQMFLKWQLMDIVSVLSPNGQVLSSIVNGLSPTLLQGPYNVSDLSTLSAAKKALNPASPGFPRTRVAARPFQPRALAERR
ncbi:hypothetical protein HRD49_18160 [Corallococcus exiguus]|uniref:Uncharacterized protein n=1 Tax=Corallococcus exiguus TaxID=83462 RepID=A0A7X4YFY3_9BACT|nr:MULTISPECIES: hypothetical protein [Corallococcus]NBC43702.1 hypothetical protein [Corallococcus exiguus]NRD45311.1 hypothetical protein [Corallococcus exiguus]NRD53275.1 hypothetical protein [Corallococcus exiguus]NRD63679.1 hypothetical protein [Corallococcus exiguus]RUO92420.1 hypothetical protein D7Y11_15000 [Corallococcus sp. AB018]